MRNPNSKAQFHMDILVAETLLGDVRLLKTAEEGGIVSSIVSKVKDYFSNKVDPNNKVDSVMNMLAPGVISVTLGALGLPWFGRLLGLAASFFHFDIASILEGIWSKIKEALHAGGGQISSNHVDQIVKSTVQDHTAPATQEEADDAAQKAEQSGQGNEPQHEADDGLALASQLRTAKLIRLAMEDEFINKEAASKGWFNLFSSRKGATGNLLGSILSLVFRVALSAGGLMLAGDVMRKWMGMDDHLGGDKPGQGPSAPQQTDTSGGAGNGTVLNSSTMSWVENVTNDPGSIENMLVGFAHEMYPQLSGKDSEIRNDPKFQYLAHTISWYNHEHPGSPIIYIPRMFTTRKQLVDTFAQDILANR